MSSELLLVSGKPGAGKSTASELAAGLIDGARHLSMGHRLRAISNLEIPSRYAAELALAKEDLAQHKAVGRPELPVLILEEFMEEQEGPVVLDGFPRYRKRMGHFRNMLETTGSRVLAACQIDVANETALERMGYRQQRNQGVSEDQTFRTRRINDYYDEVVPVIREVGTFAPIHFIDGDQSVEAVANDLASVYALESSAPNNP